ncbi:MAG TPA: nitrate reductase [Thermoleophilaceae bacterium]|nr:nitrate reductase [Thermoleophilaceae bacterium]
MDRITNPWGERTPYSRDGEWPTRVDMHLAEGVEPGDVDDWVLSASILHSNGDEIDIAVKDGRIVGVRGDEHSRVNHGRLGPKDLFGWQANNSPDRLTRPLVREGGELRETDWDTAMERVVARSQELLAEKGPGSHGFYTSGQLFLEDYYTLAVMVRAGVGTNHLDGNTRLCTATAGEALKESFGCDGQPGSYTDIDHTDTICCYGHNVAETQAVLWMRMLDRLHGSDRPKLLVVDPRRTPVAEQADIHLALRNGTNLALMNALVHELIARDWIDHDYIEANTVGFDEVEKKVRECTPRWAARICGLEASDIEAAAELIGTTERLFSTVLQGFYQSHSATSAACQVNNIHLLRGMLGRPGCGVLQMNGQPTAENTRETGANGDLPGFRNWANDAHVEELAKLWNVEPAQIPHYGPPTHAMQIFRYCEQGSIGFLWISATNPAVSLPELHRIRDILAGEGLFLVVQDIFMTETAQFADVVLPAATWGEKLGTFTNADRTVHLSERAVDPPGEARADMDIFRDYAERMGFKDRDGAPLIKWSTPEEAFEAWKECSRGRPCDYSAITYERLYKKHDIQWPCTDERPDGTERLYTDADFWADADRAETYGRDLLTGAPLEPTEYRALNPDGKALLKGAEYVPPHEEPNDEHPFHLGTGRTIYHFHTRTKTGRAPELQAAAPEPWVELCAADAERLGVSDGDLVEVASARGAVRVPARIKDIREGAVFIPFHYGYWDVTDGDPRAANELTITDWDPNSKQPLFKVGAVSVEKVAE